MEEAVGLRGSHGVYRKSLYFSLNFAMKLKIVLLSTQKYNFHS